MREEIYSEARALVERRVMAGFEPAEEIVEAVTELLEDSHGLHGVASEVEQLVRQSLAEQARRQQAWPGLTDCDRLDAAFAVLESVGIVARQNFACCQTCGHAEIHDEMKNAEHAGREIDGYVFYHAQDTDAVCSEGTLHLAFGARSGSVDDASEIARIAVQALRAQGLEVRWRGTAASRLRLRLDWKRRRALA